MTDYTDLANFSSDGLNIGQDKKVLSYLHGLSDFWVYIFDDASKVNMMLEANAVVASDIYNKFLQLTSIISLEDITVLTGSQIKLILISDKDNSNIVDPVMGKVYGKIETYYIPKETPLKSCKYLSNRAFLPTSTLVDNTDFYLDPDLGQLSFSQPLSSLGFPFRFLDDGSKEYALWAIDARIDDQLIYKHYAKLLNIDPATSTQLFKDFVYGLYYLYVNGPHLGTIKKGLNIALGIPLSRDPELVLEIHKYPNTDQWIVITDQNSYLVPYGLEPTVALGDQLNTGDEITQWIEVKDWINDGEWWINFMLPAHIMPHIPPDIPGGGGVNGDGTPDRYMTVGSYSDWLMRNYLKKHTFLVNVKTVGFKNLQNFEQLSSIIHAVKPSYTTPVYVWSVPVEDRLSIEDKDFSYDVHIDPVLDITDGIESFTRNQDTPFQRNGSRFMRISVPSWIDDITGYNPDLNGFPRQVQFGDLSSKGIVSGFTAVCQGYRDLSTTEAAWDRVFRHRNAEQYLPSRAWLDYKRNRNMTGDGEWVQPLSSNWSNKRVVYLYTATKRDLQEKFTTLSLGSTPNSYVSKVFDGNYTAFTTNFSYFAVPGTNSAYLGGVASPDNYVTFLPNLGELRTGDYFVLIKMMSDLYGVYWATSNFTLQTLPYVPHDSNDPMTIVLDGAITRGMALQGSPYFALRGTLTISYNSSDAINEKALNEEQNVASTATASYADAYNPLFNTDRSGLPLITHRTWQ